MPVGFKKYRRKDFTWLLKELNANNGQNSCVSTPANEQVEDVAVNPKSVVSDARRRRDSLMDNPRMLYAYSKKKKLLHDRECAHVKCITDEEFCMYDDFVYGIELCPDCVNRLLIRHGIGDDGRRIVEYERFFQRLGFSETELFLLMIVHNAKLKWIDKDKMQVQVRHDTWRVICRLDEVELWHNNYSCADGSNRNIERNFHFHTSCKLSRALTLFWMITSYSYEQHLASSVKPKRI